MLAINFDSERKIRTPKKIRWRIHFDRGKRLSWNQAEFLLKKAARDGWEILSDEALFHLGLIIGKTISAHQKNGSTPWGGIDALGYVFREITRRHAQGMRLGYQFTPSQRRGHFLRSVGFFWEKSIPHGKIPADKIRKKNL